MPESAALCYAAAMCGRYTITAPIEALRELFGCEGGGDLEPRYNLGPQQEAPIIRVEEGRRRLAMLRWGLIPPWAKDPTIALKLINARAEGLADKASFRNAFARRRCLVPVDGFYEWQPAGKRKQPYRITLPDGAPFALAGLWERWAPPGGPAIETFIVITTEATEQLRPIHDRMPVILTAEAAATWLDPNAPRPVLEALLVPYRGALRVYPVDARVGNARFDDPGLIAPLPEAARLL
jgi:putative SOS response-associated peptidase YedK